MAKAKTNQTVEKRDVLMVHTIKGVKHFYRAGFKFTEQPIGIDVAALTAAQIKALTQEPMLIVEEGTVELDGEEQQADSEQATGEQAE